MTLWDVPAGLEIGVIPKRIYCNKDIVLPLKIAFANLIQSGHVSELKTWDGCFNIRLKTKGKTYSVHSWGLAVDVNAFENGYGKVPKLSPGFVHCFKAAGFDWGGDWLIPDGMHFELKGI